MGLDVVSTFHDGLDDFGSLVGDQALDEEGAFDIVFSENFEATDSVFITTVGDRTGLVVGLIPIFDVAAEDIRDRL